MTRRRLLDVTDLLCLTYWRPPLDGWSLHVFGQLQADTVALSTVG